MNNKYESVLSDQEIKDVLAKHNVEGLFSERRIFQLGVDYALEKMQPQLEAIGAGGVKGQLMPGVSVGPLEDMVRFCPECGLLGDVGSEYRDCCPDGSHARRVPAGFAKLCRQLFKDALEKPPCTCPSGGGSLKHPCPKHQPTSLAIKQAILGMQRYSYGYKDDGNGMRFLSLIENPDGGLLKFIDVIRVVSGFTDEDTLENKP